MAPPKQTHCIHGHEFTPENTRLYRGSRFCRQCDRDRNRPSRYDLRIALAAAVWEAVKAADMPCAFCGEQIPEERRRRRTPKFCSIECTRKERTASGKSKDAVRTSHLKTKYGLTREQYEAMLADARCAICGTSEFNGRGKKPHIDHDHKTGRIRGLLCHGCNTSLGHFRDDPALLRKAAAYLE